VRFIQRGRGGGKRRRKFRSGQEKEPQSSSCLLTKRGLLGRKKRKNSTHSCGGGGEERGRRIRSNQEGVDGFSSLTISEEKGRQLPAASTDGGGGKEGKKEGELLM